MRIGIIGSGKIGSTAAHLFVAAGHQVAIANRRGPSSLAPLEHELGARLRAQNVEEAARFGDQLVLVAVPIGAYDALPAGAFAGRIVIDTTNCYPGRDGSDAALDNDQTTSSALLAEYLPGARIVKAFNTMLYSTLAQAGRPSASADDRLALFVAGDDLDAKRIVTGLIEELGFTAIDTGGLARGERRQQPNSPIYVKNFTGAQARRILG
jgi:8-hydroxy-5-deazaflavin:NADPH oxidoreductase